MSIYLSLVFSRAFSFATHSNFWCRDLKLCRLGFLRCYFWPSLKFTHVYFLFVGVLRFGQCSGKRFSPISNFFSLVSSRAFIDAAHSRFWCGDPKVCLRGSLKMLDLALNQIYTRVFHLSKSVALKNAWDEDSCLFIFFSLACFHHTHLLSAGIATSA